MIPEILSKIKGILQGISRNRKNGSPEIKRIKLLLSVKGMPLYRRQLARYRLDLGLIRRMIIEEREQKY
ncbi:uncharacterized protein K444DRAFT_616746 [Hyaloscypha bicolor E]|uniref:Uncharacterized protein n=1 Tax=Hyaloscypha bicolor E TaxID=1095630 RepID=A0A2J6SY26_9HELO|nr:uncharacterized protein K444DRAFT_616746 [Hyaloscypha bicolor E]PMD55685.1 hypothetical protein K444DRAFT_616746 [Hyaloscypha bicolor E]